MFDIFQLPSGFAHMRGCMFQLTRSAQLRAFKFNIVARSANSSVALPLSRAANQYSEILN